MTLKKEFITGFYGEGNASYWLNVTLYDPTSSYQQMNEQIIKKSWSYADEEKNMKAGDEKTHKEADWSATFK